MVNAGMEYPLFKARFADKKIGMTLIILAVIINWCYTAVALLIDEDLLFGLPVLLIPSIIGIVVFFVLTAKKDITFTVNGLQGMDAKGKRFNLGPGFVKKVDKFGINGIKITDISNKSYTFSAIENRDEICTVMFDYGIPVEPKLVVDKTALVVSGNDIRKQNILRLITLVSAALGTLSVTISAIWFNSPGNRYYSTYTAYYYAYGYKIPYEKGYWKTAWWPEEMFTTYIAIAFGLIFIVALAIYMKKANARVSVGPQTVRAVDGFGKVTVMPIHQISANSIKAMDSSVAMNALGKKLRYSFLVNFVDINQAINNMKTGNYVVATANPAANAYQTAYNQPAAPMPAAAPAPTAAPAGNVTDELRSLKELYDSGIITAEEFEAKKKQLLGL